MTDGATPDFLVVELGQGPAAAYCGWMFAQAGHEVVLVEPPGGHPLRSPGEGSPADAGAAFLTLASAKRSVAVDLATASGRESLHRLLRAAAVLVTDSPQLLDEAGITPEMLRETAPGLVHISISPFGESGPYAGYAATSATLYALGGHTYITGEADREPLNGPHYFPEFLAGATAFVAAQAALLGRGRSGAGQKVELSAMECLLAGHQFTLTRHSYQDRTLERTGNRYASLVGVNFYDCADGVAALAASSQAQLEQLFLLTEHTEFIGDPRFAALATLPENLAAFDAAIAPWFAARPRDEVVEQCQAFRIPCAPVLEVDEVLSHQQLQARKFWRPAEDASGRSLQLPRLPFRIRGSRDEAIAAPALGADQGLLESLPAAGGTPSSAPTGGVGAPLAGIRVLDLTRVWSGPVATRMLADLGAEVIKIEHPGSRGPLGPDGGAAQNWNRNGLFNELNRNKKSIAIDLAAPGARDTFLALAERCDLVIENFSPRVMGNLGIDFETLSARNPRIVMVSMPGYGLTGPMRDGVAYGTTIDSESGTASVIGYPGEGPMRMGVAFPDYVAGIHAAGASVAALVDRARSGSGQHVDLSQFESISAFMGPAVVEWQLTGVRPPRMGNRCPGAVPSGIYPCLDDRWIAINVQSDGQWARLCDLMRRNDLAGARLSTADGRLRWHDDLDAAISAWTATREAPALMDELQAAGIAAGQVLSGPELFADRQSRARGFFVELEHPLVGRHEYPGLPFSIAGVTTEGWTDAPCLGEHNASVLASLLGYDDAAIAALYEAGAIADRPQA
ncbi:MAG TPA: CoA transferase [Tepidiformaceae bacterium]|nr:CoA transferase [Tepidiformaceae bacterium]